MTIHKLSAHPDKNRTGDEESWREQFPIDTVKEQHQNRRQFLKTVVTGSAMLACGQVALVAADARRASVRQLSDQRMVLDVNIHDMENGEAILFHYPDDHSPCLLIKMSETRVLSYSQKCTHLACPVIPKADEGILFCPCHKGAFDLETGTPLYGPPKRALPRLRLSVADNGIMTIEGMEQLL